MICLDSAFSKPSLYEESSPYSIVSFTIGAVGIVIVGKSGVDWTRPVSLFSTQLKAMLKASLLPFSSFGSVIV